MGLDKWSSNTKPGLFNALKILKKKVKKMLTESKNYGIIILVHEKRGQKIKIIKKDINNRIERDEKINKQ